MPLSSDEELEVEASVIDDMISKAEAILHTMCEYADQLASLLITCDESDDHRTAGELQAKLNDMTILVHRLDDCNKALHEVERDLDCPLNVALPSEEYQFLDDAVSLMRETLLAQRRLKSLIKSKTRGTKRPSKQRQF